MPEPLVCEDSDLQRLLQTVHGQPGAEILYQDVVRRGGVFGFFAREVHRVAYRVVSEAGTTAPADAGTAAPSVSTTAPSVISTTAPSVISTTAPSVISTTAPTVISTTAPTVVPAGELSGLEELLAAAEAVESAGQHRADEPARAAAPRHEFAELLQALTDDEPAAAPADEPAPAGTGRLNPQPVAPVRQPAPRTNVTSIGRPDARARLEMLMQLRQVGVPVSVNPRADTHSLYEALENILEELPAPATPPRGAGEVLAVVGESGPALQAAHTCAAMLRIPRDRIAVAGLPDHRGAGADHTVVSGPREALRLRTELGRADLPQVVVIATDATEAGSQDPWAAEMVAALRPTAVWAVVDARWKTEDSQAQLDRLGRVDALVVHSAQLSASPASVWDLDLPLGLLDGRAASTFAWAGLLFPLLRRGARHRASA